jgi:DNA-binding PadR family transcriptional regulator
MSTIRSPRGAHRASDEAVPRSGPSASTVGFQRLVRSVCSIHKSAACYALIVRLLEYSYVVSKPLHEPTFLILTALLPAPLHGYGLLSDIERLTGGRVRLRVGTLYAALDRLTDEGLVEVDSEETVNGRLRRTYCVTAAGSAALSAESDRMIALGNAARARLRGRPAAGAAAAAGLSIDGAR